MNYLDLPTTIKPFPQLRAPRILALSGGGYCGLFTAEVLRQLQAWTDTDLDEQFDLFAGTSIGGILAIGLALGGKRADTLPQLLIEHGEKIFPRSARVWGFNVPRLKLPGAAGGLFGAKYPVQPLIDALEAVFSAKTLAQPIGGVPRPFLVTTTCATTRAPIILTNLPPITPGCETMTILQAMLATAAAPGYFPAVEFGPRSLVDGGLVANAPELAAVACLIERHRASADTVRVLSIGAAAKVPAKPENGLGSMGLLKWLAGDLLPLTIFAQERLTVEVAQSLLGKRYLRIEAQPKLSDLRAIDLDRADKPARTALQLMAQDAAKRLGRETFMDWMA